MKPSSEPVSPRRPSFKPFFAKEIVSTSRAPMKNNKHDAKAPDAKKPIHSSKSVEYTYPIENLLSNGGINVKTNFRMK